MARKKLKADDSLTLITMQEAAAKCGRSYKALHHWTTRGILGIRLKAVYRPTKHTCIAWIDEFLEKVDAAKTMRLGISRTIDNSPTIANRTQRARKKLKSV